MNEENKEDLKEFGQVILEKDSEHHIMLLTIIGEIEGHEAAPEKNKTTRYDHVLPRLAEFEDDDRDNEPRREEVHPVEEDFDLALDDLEDEEDWESFTSGGYCKGRFDSDRASHVRNAEAMK